MKKALIMLLGLCLAGSALAQDSHNGYGGRWLGTMTTNIVFGTQLLGDPARIESINIRFTVPATTTIAVMSTLSSNQYLRMSQTVTNASSVVLIPDKLWLRRDTRDSLAVSFSSSNNATVVVDYAR